MKRLYYLTDIIDSADRISEAIHAAGVTDWNFHVLSKDKAGLKSHHLHSTSLIHERDIIRSGERGGLVGVTAGLFGALAVALSSWWMQEANMIILALIVFAFALVGAWVGGMNGLVTDNVKISQFHDAIEAGRFLIMIDVDSKNEMQIIELMQGFRSA